MSGPPKICGVILAAGASSRMGRDKALLPWPGAASGASAGGETLLSAAIRALQPFVEAVIVVGGRNAESIAPLVAECGAMLARNPAPERGQFSSMQVGLRAALDRGYGATMITPVDCPPLSAASLRALCAAFEEALKHGRWAVAPENNGKRGHPLLAGSELIEALVNAPVTSNAREVKRGCAQYFEYVAVPDPLIHADMNTPEQYAATAAQVFSPGPTIPEP